MSSISKDATSIGYSGVSAKVDIINNCALAIGDIFDEFGLSIARVGADDVFVGDASDTLRTRFNSLKTTFDDYVKLIETFSTSITGASSDTKETDKRTEREAEEYLKGR